MTTKIKAGTAGTICTLRNFGKQPSKKVPVTVVSSGRSVITVQEDILRHWGCARNPSGKLWRFQFNGRNWRPAYRLKARWDCGGKERLRLGFREHCA